MSEIKIVAVAMGTNRLWEFKPIIERHLPYVDKYIIIDGGSQDESLLYFRNWSESEKKINAFLHPWPNNFPKQRNNYLKHAKELCNDGNEWWVIVHDTDESFTDGFLENIKTFIEQANADQVNVLDIQCHARSFKGNKQVHHSIDQSWKPLIYKLYPETHYDEDHNPHEHLKQPNRKDARIGGVKASPNNKDVFYFHDKQENAIWIRGMRNFLVGGGGPNLGDKNPYWKELKDIVAGHFGGKYPDDYQVIEKWFLKGNLPQDMKDWLINRARVCEEVFPGHADGSSEVRETYKSYFRLWHPEEEPEELREVSVG